MLLRIPALKIPLAIAAMIAVSIPVAVEDTKGMAMGAHDVAQMPGDVTPDPGDLKEGETEAMSGGTEMDHDMHMGNGDMKNMSLHMAYTELRPENDADKARAAALLTDLQHALAKYQDYHAAEADGFQPFHPEFKLPVVHFTNNWYGAKAAFTFSPTQPTSLLYQHTPDGGYKLIGAMYTDRKGASEDELNQRVPLSVARWHRHINLCFPVRRSVAKTANVDWTRFGFNGSIATKQACDAANGRFYPQVFGWMVHVYPWEPDPKLVWAR
jgi:hypothetical protein